MNRSEKVLKIKCSLNFGGEGTAMRAVIAASLAALSISGVYAQDSVPLPQAGDTTAGASSDYTQESSIKEYPSKLEGGGYTLTRLEQKPDSGDFVTGYSYDSLNKTATPAYYRLDLKQTEYGTGDSVKYWGWTTNENGDKTFGEVEQANADIMYNYTAPTTSLDGIYSGSNDTFEVSGGDFVGQSSSSGFGGAIYNRGSAGAINANFFGNNVTNNDYGSGGAIYNHYVPTVGSYTMDSITGNFIGNYIESSGSGSGGAIYNTQNLGSIKGDFVGNYVQSGDYGYGGAIANAYSAYYNSIGDIIGNFIGNYVKSSNSYGGAIANYGTGSGNNSKINSINANFVGNHAEAVGYASGGGAIYNLGQIGNITGDFIGNYASGEMAAGGAIGNAGKIGDITGDFIGNYASGQAALGGAIYNEGQIGDITGDFIGNYVSAQREMAAGGAIGNAGKIGDITGDFIGNYVSAQGETLGGAIYNNKKQIGDIKGDFIGNYASGEMAAGGAIGNAGKIGGIKGDFIGNYASGEMAAGGAIYNAGFWSGYYGEENVGGNIASITGDFIGNYASGQEALGGAIYNTGTIGYQRVITIMSQTAVNSDTGETLTCYGAQNGTSIADIQDMIASGYQIEVKDARQVEVSDAEWQEVISDIKSHPDTVFTTAPEELFGKENMYSGTVPAGIVNSSFIGNYAKSETGEAAAGAIYTNQNLMLAAKDGYTSIISGNYVEDINGKRNEAIYVGEQAELGFEATSNGQFVIDDMINGTDGYSVSFSGDETGVVYLNNKITAEPLPASSTEEVSTSTETQTPRVNISMSDITLNLGQDNFIDNNNLTLNSGNVNMINNQAGVSALNSMTVTGDVNFVADVDLANESMDRFTANTYGEHTGNLHVTGMNMLSDAPEDRDITEIYFAQQGLKDNVINGVNETPTSYQTTAYTPIYRYNVAYDNRDDAGYFVFAKGDRIISIDPGTGGTTTTPSGNPSDAFNPAVLSSPVAAQAGAYAAQNVAFSHAFQHADTFMPLPSIERFALRNANRYAVTDYNNLSFSDNDFHNKAMWVRPYTSFETIPLKNGPDVDTITYGTLIGGDSDFKELKNGWGNVFTGYVGYNGSSQSYSGVNTYQNGGLIGATQTFYKGNFFTAITATAGAMAGESHNMYGKEDFTTLMAGIGSKTGYNIEFKDGKFIIQPVMLLSYSFINTFDYTNSAGVRIDSDPLHAIQLNPSVRFIANLKNGWQPYASVGMVWNLLDKSDVRANDVRLPEMSVKPYVEYGVGIQRRWNDKYTGYLQAMVRNGGRNGVALTAGFRWALGQDGKPIEKVDKNVNKTSRTDRIGILSW